MISIAITSINSTSVKARARCDESFLTLPVGNVIVGSFPSVGTHGVEVVGIAVVSAGTLIDVRIAPRIRRYDRLALEIRSMPVLNIAGPAYQCEKGIPARWITARVLLEPVDGLLEG